MVGRRVRLARACSGGVLLLGCGFPPTVGHGAPAGGEVPAGYGAQAQAAASAPGDGSDGGGTRETGSAAATPDGGDPGGAAQEDGPAAVAPGDGGPADAAQGYGGPAATSGDGNPDGAAQGYGDPADGGQAGGYAPPQPPPVYGYLGGGSPADPGPGQPIVGPDGLTYVDGVPIGLLEGEAVPLLFVGEQGGWGYYDRGRQWHDAPPDVRDRLERSHPGGRGLPPVGVARRRSDRPAFQAQERLPPAAGPGPGMSGGPSGAMPGGPTVFRGEHGEDRRPADRGPVAEVRAVPGHGEAGRFGGGEQAVEHFQGAPGGPGQGARVQRGVEQGFAPRGPGGQQPGNPLRLAPPARLGAPPARGPGPPRP